MGERGFDPPQEVEETKCSYCGSIGHDTDNCPKLHEEHEDKPMPDVAPESTKENIKESTE